MRRRQFVAAAATAGTTLLAGCLTDGNGQSDDSESEGTKPSLEQGTLDSEISADLETILDVTPETIAGEQIASIMVSAAPQDPKPASPSAIGDVAADYDLEPTDLASVAVTSYGDGSRSVGVLVGSFDEESVDAPTALTAPAVHVEDGLIITGKEDFGPWQEGVDAALETKSGSDTELHSPQREQLFAPVEGSELIMAGLSTQESESEEGSVREGVDPEFQESVEGIARGVIAIGDRQIAVSTVIQFSSETAVSRETAVELVEGMDDSVEEDDIEFTQDGNRLLAAFEREAPAEYLPDNAPTANFDIDRDGTLEHNGNEPVDPANLEFRVGGEPRTPPWGEREEPIETGDQFEFEAAPLEPVEVVWLDPELNGVTEVLGQGLIVEDGSFTSQFDEKSAAYEITYRGDEPLDTDPLSVEISVPRTFEQEEISLAEFVGETVEPDETFTVAEATAEDQISIRYTLEAPDLTTTVVIYTAGPARRSGRSETDR